MDKKILILEKISNECLTIIVIAIITFIIVSFAYKTSNEKDIVSAQEEQEITQEVQNNYTINQTIIVDTFHPWDYQVEIQDEVTKILEGDDLYDSFIEEICKDYELVTPELIKSMVYHESRYEPHVSNGPHIGLMQINPAYQTERMEKFDVSDLYDPYDNIKVGTDFMEYLIDSYGSTAYALMVYNMGPENAKKMYSSGIVSYYAQSVMEMARRIKDGESEKE